MKKLGMSKELRSEQYNILGRTSECDQQKQKKIVDTNTYMSVFRELLSEGREVSLTITGSSMSPFIVHGRDAILITPPDGTWKKGDMAFFQRDNGQYVMHRICRIEDDGNCFFIGDAQQIIEGSVRPEQIFGKITAVRRKGKWIQAGSFWWEFFEHIWLNIIPFRGFFVKLYSIVWNIKDKCATIVK